jgi:hypothetical protein
MKDVMEKMLDLLVWSLTTYCGNVFANIVGDGSVVLELHPLRLGWQDGQLAHESLELRAVHHAISP